MTSCRKVAVSMLSWKPTAVKQLLFVFCCSGSQLRCFSGLIVALLTGTTQWDKLFPSQFSYLAGGFQGTLQETFFVSLLTLNVCDVNTYNALVAVLLIDVFQTLSLALGHKVRLCNPVTKVDCSTSLVKASCNHYNKKSFLIDGHFILGIKKIKPYGAASVQNQEPIVNILQGM